MLIPPLKANSVRMHWFLGLFSFMFFYLAPRYSSAQDPLLNGLHSQWKMSHLTVDQGLSNNFVHCITRDKHGYIWIATSYGLNRFNGISVENYYSDTNQPFSLNSNFITRLLVDSENQLWIATDKGLMQYDDVLDQFREVTIPDGKKEREVFDITENSNGDILIGTNSGFYKFSKSDKKVVPFSIQSAKNQTDSVYRILVDRNNQIWFSSFKNGLTQLDKHGKVLQEFHHNSAPGSLAEDWIFCLYEDSKGKIWAGTYNNGISLYLPESQQFKNYVIDKEAPYTLRVRTIFEDKSGRIFAGTRFGLYVLNDSSDQFELYAREDHEISKLSQNSVTYSYVDQESNIWLGTHSGGITYFSQLQKTFVHFRQVSNDHHFLSDATVHCFAEKGQQLLIGTDKGLNVYNQKSGQFQYFSNDPKNPKTLSYDDVKNIAVQSPDSIWVATNRGGLNLMNRSFEVVKTYRHSTSDPNSLPSDNLYNLQIDRKNQIWILTNTDWDREAAQLSRFSPKTGQFKLYPGAYFMGFHQSAERPLLAGGTFGFYQYDESKDEMIAFENKELIYRTNALYQDKKNRVWAGCNTGLFLYDFSKNEFEKIELAKNDQIQQVYGLIADGDDLWISTNNGLLQIQNIYGKMSLQRFNQQDGLQSREFNYNAYYKTQKGTLLFGGDNGFNAFQPKSILANPYLPEICLTSLRLDGQEIQPGKSYFDQIILEKALRHTNSICIPHFIRSVSLEFDILHYANPASNQFKYRLVNADNIWTQANVHQNSVTYHNLPPGEYQFELIGLNSDNKESAEQLVLHLEILPPFWATWWFRSLLALVVITTVLTIFWIRTLQLRKQRLQLQQTVRARTNELVEEREQLKKTMGKLVESEKLASLGIFTAGVAHEINNPMNYISGATHQLFDILKEHFKKYPDRYDQESKETIWELEDLIKSGIQRIARIVESLKNYTRADNNVFTKHDIVKSIEDALNITSSKRSKYIAIHKQYPEQYFIECLPSRITQVLINLLDNAADAIGDRGDIYISIKDINNQVCISVKDTGSGVNPDDIKYLFDPFFTTKEVGKGTGLGLYVSHGYIQRHGGEIQIKTAVGEGAEFCVVLPKKQS